MEFQEDFQSDDRHEVDDTLLVSSRDEAMKEQKYNNEEEEQEEQELRDAFYMSGFPQPTDDGSEEPAEETHIQEPAKAVSAFENLGMLKMQEPSTLFYEAINNAMGTFAWKDEHKDEDEMARTEEQQARIEPPKHERVKSHKASKRLRYSAGLPCKPPKKTEGGRSLWMSLADLSIDGNPNTAEKKRRWKVSKPFGQLKSSD